MRWRCARGGGARTAIFAIGSSGLGTSAAWRVPGAVPRTGSGLRVTRCSGVALAQVFGGERRTGTAAQQTFEPGAAGALDTHRAIHREAAVVRPGAHFAGVIAVDRPTPDEGAQDPGSHARLHLGKRRRVEGVGKGGMKGNARHIVRGYVRGCVRRDVRRVYAVDDATVKTKFQCRLRSGLSTLSEAAGTKVEVQVAG